MRTSYRKKEQAWGGSGVRDRTGRAGLLASRVSRGVAWVPRESELGAGRSGYRRRCGPGPAHCRQVTLAPLGALRHTTRASLIGSSREPRPLSCSWAGFSVAAIFVDVSAPRGVGEA